MAFELFNRKRTHGGPPAVSITRFGMFVINSAAIEKYFRNHKYATIYWDKEGSRVGIKPLTKKEEKAYSIHFSPKGNVGSLSATAFLKYIGFENKETESFSATWSERDGLLEFKVERKRFPRLKE